MGYNYLPSCNFLHIGVQVEVTSFILSGTMLKSLFAENLTSEIVMRKLALKIGMIPQKSECWHLWDSPDPLLINNAIATQISRAGSYIPPKVWPRIKH